MTGEARPPPAPCRSRMTSETPSPTTITAITPQPPSVTSLALSPVPFTSIIGSRWEVSTCSCLIPRVARSGGRALVRGVSTRTKGTDADRERGPRVVQSPSGLRSGHPRGDGDAPGLDELRIPNPLGMDLPGAALCAIILVAKRFVGGQVPAAARGSFGVGCRRIVFASPKRPQSCKRHRARALARAKKMKQGSIPSIKRRR